MERVAAQEALHGHPAATAYTEPFHCFARVGRARGREPATGTKKWRDQQAIGCQESAQQPHRPRLHVAAGTWRRKLNVHHGSRSVCASSLVTWVSEALAAAALAITRTSCGG